jgi:hypothetical protein
MNIFIIQKRVIGIMLRMGPRHTCWALDIITVPCLYIYTVMLNAHNNLNIFQTNSSVHGMNTRQQNKLHIPSERLSSILRGVYYSSVEIFNQLPQYVVIYYNNIHTFKTLLRDCLVKSAFYSIEEFLSASHNNEDIWTFKFNFLQTDDL